MNLRIAIPAALIFLGLGIAATGAQTASLGLIYPPSTAPNSFFGTVNVQPGVT
jgi:hypothetical protein